MSVQTRIFLGYIQNKEIKLHLKQSVSWQQAKSLSLSELEEIHWNDKEYIGRFIPPLLNCEEIKGKEAEIKTQLQLYCPNLKLDKHSPYLLSQIFIL